MTCHIMLHKRYFKLRWFDQHFPDHEVIVEINNAIVSMCLIDLKRKGMQSENKTT